MLQIKEVSFEISLGKADIKVKGVYLPKMNKLGLYPANYNSDFLIVEPGIPPCAGQL
jgi:hypothetical protein